MDKVKKDIVIQGVNDIVTLCNECLSELNKENLNESRISDILAEDIPERSEKIFELIYNWFCESNPDVNKVTVDKFPH